jgi:hypothetical protein
MIITNKCLNFVASVGFFFFYLPVCKVAFCETIYAMPIIDIDFCKTGFMSLSIIFVFKLLQSLLTMLDYKDFTCSHHKLVAFGI